MLSCMHHKMVLTFESMKEIRKVELFWEFEMSDAVLFVIEKSIIFFFKLQRYFCLPQKEEQLHSGTQETERKDFLVKVRQKIELKLTNEYQLFKTVD